jgi:hypothetical protein
VPQPPRSLAQGQCIEMRFAAESLSKWLLFPRFAKVDIDEETMIVTG